MSREISRTDFERFLSIVVDSYDSYIYYLSSVMEKENTNFDNLSKNISFYLYKYKNFDIDGISEKTRKNYLTALNWLYKYLNPKKEYLIFKIKSNNQLSFKEYEEINNKLIEINKEYQLISEDEESIRIQKIEKGSICITFVFCSALLFSFKLVKVIKAIKELIDSNYSEKPSAKKRAILKCASAILDIAAFLLPLGPVSIISGSVVIELTEEIINYIEEKIGSDE